MRKNASLASPLALALMALSLLSKEAWCAEIRGPLQLDYSLIRQILLCQLAVIGRRRPQNPTAKSTAASGISIKR